MADDFRRHFLPQAQGNSPRNLEAGLRGTTRKKWGGVESVFVYVSATTPREVEGVRLNIVVWGPPASGKSTLCAELKKLLRARFPAAKVVLLAFDTECLGGRQDLPRFSPQRFAELQNMFLARV